MQSKWDFVQYPDNLNQSISEENENIFKCGKCYLLVDHGYQNDKKNRFLCSICFKKLGYNN